MLCANSSKVQSENILHTIHQLALPFLHQAQIFWSASSYFWRLKLTSLISPFESSKNVKNSLLIVILIFYIYQFKLFQDFICPCLLLHFVFDFILLHEHFQKCFILFPKNRNLNALTYS